MTDGASISLGKERVGFSGAITGVGSIGAMIGKRELQAHVNFGGLSASVSISEGRIRGTLGPIGYSTDSPQIAPVNKWNLDPNAGANKISNTASHLGNQVKKLFSF